jgi:hypothetical protein
MNTAVMMTLRCMIIFEFTTILATLYFRALFFMSPLYESLSADQPKNFSINIGKSLNPNNHGIKDLCTTVHVAQTFLRTMGRFFPVSTNAPGKVVSQHYSHYKY